MNRVFLFALGMIFFSYSLGNGGPIDGSAVYKTGDIILINRPQINLLKEDLNIKVEGDYSIVEVTYLLQNQRYSMDTLITYGFPIDFIRNDIEYELNWKKEYLPSIEFFLDGKPLPIEHQVDLGHTLANPKDFDGMEVDVRRSWHVVNFSIGKGQQVTLKVNYKVKNGYEDWATTKSFFPGFSERRLLYDFSPAMYWAEGIVPSFNVSVDLSSILEIGGEGKLTGLSLAENAGIYASSFENFDLKKAPDLVIQYINKQEKLSQYVLDHQMDRKYLKNIKVSSSLKGDYGQNNLLDGDFQTAWVEGVGGDGLGEKIEIELEEYPLAAICLLNGYTKNSDTYVANNRIKKIRVERELTDFDDPSKMRVETEEIELKDLGYVKVDENTLGQIISVVGDYGEGYMRVQKITLTILEVYKGSKYSDTCISEIFLLGYSFQ